MLENLIFVNLIDPDEVFRSFGKVLLSWGNSP